MTAWNARAVIETTESPEPVAEVPDTPDAELSIAPTTSDLTRWDEKAVAAVTRFVIDPRTRARAARGVILFLLVLHSFAGFALVVAIVATWDYHHGKRIKHGRQRWKRINARQKRMKAHKKKHWEIGKGKDKTKIPCVWRTPLAVAKAVKFETGITPQQRRTAWLAVTCERIGIDPPLRLIHWTEDAAENEVWELGVPISPSMNPSRLSHDDYAAGIRACVRGTCYGVHIHASSDRGGVAFMRLERHDIRSVDAGPSPLITRVRGLEPVINAPATIAAPVQIGLTAMKQPFMVNLMDRSGIGIFGQNGTGKSRLLHTFACVTEAAPDAIGRLGDMKDGMDGRLHRNALHYSEDPDDVHEWISQYAVFKEREKGGKVTSWRAADAARDRAKYLQDRGLSNWEPGCGLAADIFIIDEVDNIAANDQFALAWMINKLRAIGVRVIVSSQGARADTLDKRLITALNVKILFRVADRTAATTVASGIVGRGYLADELPVPGYCYVIGSTEQNPVIVRTHMLEDADVKLIASKFPRPKPQQSGESSDPAPDLTVSDPPMEGQTAADSQIVRSPLALVPPLVEPPAECASNEQLMALWNAMPGKRAALADASGYHPNYVSDVMNRWQKQGYVLPVRGQWTHRQPRT